MDETSDESLAFVQTEALVDELRSRYHAAIIAVFGQDRRTFDIYIKGGVIELGGLSAATSRHIRNVLAKADPTPT